jgi:beta-mannanase
VIVTFEPWRDVQQEKDSLLFVNILAGRYDAQLNQLRAIISSLPRTVYLRWTHEMEIPVDRYPWQQQDPALYIRAYRYIAQRVKAPNVKLVWGPAGDRGCMEWWPGSDVVDYVSIAIYGLPDKNITDHTKQHSFGHIFKTKYHRLRFTHKPVFITEFGVRGPENYKREWLDEAARVYQAASWYRRRQLF